MIVNVVIVWVEFYLKSKDGTCHFNIFSSRGIYQIDFYLIDNQGGSCRAYFLQSKRHVPLLLLTMYIYSNGF